MSGGISVTLYLMKDRKRSLYYGAIAGMCFLLGFFLCGKAEANIENVGAGCVYFVNDGL